MDGWMLEVGGRYVVYPLDAVIHGEVILEFPLVAEA